MARLDALPSIDIIRGFKGVLDFYLWKGLPCVRRWPRMTKAQMSQATIDAGILFGEISTNYRLLAPLALDAYQIEAQGQPRTARDLYISGVYGHLHERTEAPEPPPEEQMYDAYVCLRDLKTTGTHGGTFNAGAWITRDLNDEQADPEDICALAANQFVLAAGTYRCTISCPAYRVNEHKARLYNVTAAAEILVGSSQRGYSGHQVVTRSLINGRFTIAAAQTLRIEHRCGLGYANSGFGHWAGWNDEVYTIAEFWRETT